MLIVNADDWGLRPEITDAILECWEAGAISSASAMVHMADSERAFGLAAGAGLPIGLHLNLTTPYTAQTTGVEARGRHRRAVEYFAGSKVRRHAFDPPVARLLDAGVADQLSAFAAARGGAPATHADGHQHVHVCPTVLAAPSLGAVRSLRRAHAFIAGQRRHSAKRAYRSALNLIVRWRFRSVPFVSLRDLHPALGGVGVERLGEMARAGDVEVMTHPAWEDERAVLLSPEWARLVRELPTGSYADLA